MTRQKKSIPAWARWMDRCDSMRFDAIHACIRSRASTPATERTAIVVEGSLVFARGRRAGRRRRRSRIDSFDSIRFIHSFDLERDSVVTRRASVVRGGGDVDARARPASGTGRRGNRERARGERGERRRDGARTTRRRGRGRGGCGGGRGREARARGRGGGGWTMVGRFRD